MEIVIQAVGMIRSKLLPGLGSREGRDGAEKLASYLIEGRYQGARPRVLKCASRAGEKARPLPPTHPGKGTVHPGAGDVPCF